MRIRRWGVVKSAPKDINITPFLDVLLVLLIVFMATASSFMASLEVALPKSGAQSASEAPSGEFQGIVITVQKDGKLNVNGKSVFFKDLASEMPEQKDKTIYLAGDNAVRYGLVVAVLDRLKEIGFENVILVTEQDDGN